jgi:hypothetical protein
MSRPHARDSGQDGVVDSGQDGVEQGTCIWSESRAQGGAAAKIASQHNPSTADLVFVDTAGDDSGCSWVVG